MTTANDNLTEDERKLFDDPAIEAAYQAWRDRSPAIGDRDPVPSRKQFLLRIRFLLQQGKLP